MRYIMNHLRSKCRYTDCSQIAELADSDTLTWGHRSRFIGLILDDELLALDFKKFTA
ncbi:hypothetical protein LCGC14_1919040, partial [marine sediment metagenome]